MHSLSDSTQGYTYTIKWMFGLPEVMKSMHDMDIHEAAQFMFSANSTIL